MYSTNMIKNTWTTDNSNASQITKNKGAIRGLKLIALILMVPDHYKKIEINTNSADFDIACISL